MKKTSRRKWPQFLVLILCNTSVLSFGLQAGWLSPLQPSLQSENSPLGIRPLTIEEISWIGSLPSLSLILASPFFGFCLNRFGRKLTCLIATAPNLLNYILLLFSRNVYLLYLARLIGGFCSCGGFVMAPIYVNEISETRMRGLLGGLMGFIIKVGIILSYVLGSYASYTTLNVVSSSFTILFLACYSWMPESPVYLAGKNRREEARKSLVKLMGSDDESVRLELTRIDQMIETGKNSKSISYRSFFSDAAASKALIIVCGIYTFQMMCGYPAIMRYSVHIFQTSSRHLSPDLGAIAVAVTQLLFALVGAALLDRIGRKSMLMASTFFMGLSLTCFSGYMLAQSYLENFARISSSLDFVPVATLISFISSYALGYGSVPFVILPELFAPEARAGASTLSNLWISFLEFAVVKMFPAVSNWIGLGPTLLIFAGNCVAGFVFYHYVMIETKDSEFETIYRKLIRGKKSGNIESEILKPLKFNNDSESK